MNSIKKILEENYNIVLESVSFLKIENIDYEINNTRRVYVINNKYILKEIFNTSEANINYLYEYLKLRDTNNYIAPIINKNGKFVTLWKNNSMYIVW